MQDKKMQRAIFSNIQLQYTQFFFSFNQFVLYSIKDIKDKLLVFLIGAEKKKIWVCVLGFNIYWE